MDNSLSFLYVVYFISIVIYVLTGIAIAFLVIPLQARMAQVQDSLVKLRQQMLFKGVLSLTMVAASIIVLTLRFVVTDPVALRYLLVTLVLVQALSLFAQALIDFRIYHQQYDE